MIKKNKLNKIKNAMRLIFIVIFLLLVPFIIIFVINEEYKKIIKTPENYYENRGIVENFGITIKIYRGNRATSKTPTFFVKIKNNDTLYSYSQSIFNRNYEKITNNLKKGDIVRIYHEGFNKNQNTVNIVQLERNDVVIISKTLFNKKQIELIIALFFFLLVSLFPMYMFVKYGYWRRRSA